MFNQIFVSLDLETTGLDPEKDRIIEIGAIKFQGDKELGTFQTLVNPHCSLSWRIRMLTGITSEELETAPDFSEVADGLLSFVGDHPILGQNINFDLQFLSSEGLSFSNTTYDTLEIANIILPQLAEYGLASLARKMEIPYPVQHRALADAVMVKEVFLSFLNRASELELPLVAEINRLTTGTNWVWRPWFLDLERSKVGEASLWDSEAWELDSMPRAPELPERKPLAPEGIRKPLDLARLTALLSEDGPLAAAFPGFEYRAGQVAMMQEITEALNGRQHSIIEAGTGIGKSIAYLLPAIFFALENNSPVVISTNTINLQEQLMNKDIPDLLRVLGGVGNGHVNANLKVAQLKGRSNYLCLRRWNSWRKTPELAWEEARFLLRLLLWIHSTASGDRAEINFTGSESAWWNRICASEENCVVDRCPHYPEGCFLYRARQKADGAHLIVVNHALLLSDLVRGGILPDYSCLIVDEAHHLEEEATEQLGFQVADQDLHACLDRFGDRSGFLFCLRNYLRTASIGASRRREVRQKVEGLQAKAKMARTRVDGFLDALTRFLDIHHREEQQGYERRLRITGSLRRQPGWSDIGCSWENLELELGAIETGLGDLYAMMEDLPDRRNPDRNSSLGETSYLWQQVRRIRSQMNSVVLSPEAHYVYWASARSEGNLCLHVAPLHVGRLLEEPLFFQKDCVVLTSATLSTDGNFEYVEGSLGLSEPNELVVDPPFDYITSTMIYLPQDMPEPDKAGYQHAVGEALVELCRATRGRTLALFTSHASLRSAYGAIQSTLDEEGILVLGQGIDGGPRKLLDRFKGNPESLLMGAAAFWEGVDLVGNALSVLVIIRLPFGVPNDPVSSARAELFDDPFNQYMVPQAILKFKQGFGRLIRSRSDRGVVVVLDRRLQSKSYGRAFLNSLPKCTVKSDTLRQMPQEVVRWLGD
jgi:predicted DnaQ family exonuclease/DinG family helicase